MERHLLSYNERIWLGFLATPIALAAIMLPAAAASDTGGSPLLILVLALVCAIALALYAVSRPGMKRTGLYLPDFFLAGLLVYALGAGFIYATDGTAPAYTVLLMAQVALLSACVGLMGGSVLIERRLPEDHTQHNIVHWNTAKGEEALIYWGLVVSGFVCAYFSFTVLQTEAVATLLSDAFNMVAGDSEALTRARKAITHGSEGYFAPGFVMQFRDILMPILLCAVILIGTRKRLSKAHLAIVVASTAIALFAMILTGVRSLLFFFFIALAIGRSLAQRALGKKVRRTIRRQVFFVSIAIITYGVLTILLGRATDDAGLIFLPFEIIANLLDRIVTVVPRANIDTYAFWTEWRSSFGSQWLSDLRIVLPGSAGIGLLNLLHEYGGGSLEGNSPLGLPVDVWLNWGWAGVLIIPALYGLFIVYFDYLLVNMRSPVAFGIKVVLAVALIKIYSPIGFILYGGMLSMLLYVGLRTLHASESTIGVRNLSRYYARPFSPTPRNP